jgi:cytochrome c biogenesis protein CcdA
VLFGSALIGLGLTLSERWERLCEVAVGFLLVALGADVLRRLRAGRVHLHAHEHDDGTVHVHAHRHRSGREAGRHPFQHEHYHPAIRRSVLVGGVHGLAGSAALVLLSVQSTDSAAGAIAYLVAFGAGSILGMVALSVAMTLPLRFSVRRIEAPLHRLEVVLGCASIAIGFWVVARAGGWA